VNPLLFTPETEHKHSSSSASWGAEMFKFESVNSFRLSICEFEKGTNYFNLNSFDVDIESVEHLLIHCNQMKKELGPNWYDELKDDLYRFFSYEPEHTYENQFNPPPSKPYDWHLAANKVLLIALFNKVPWKAKVISSAINQLSTIDGKNLHIFFSSFLYDAKFYVTLLSPDTYKEVSITDNFDITVQDIFRNSLLTYSSDFR
jgi:hypothetical protein